MKPVLSQYSVAVSDLVYKARDNNKNYNTTLLPTSLTPWTPEGTSVFFSENPDLRDGNKDHKKG
jgi:hypothetical protein